jgi:hypothetical protein
LAGPWFSLFFFSFSLHYYQPFLRLPANFWRTLNPFIFELHEGLPRQGPESDACTEQTGSPSSAWWGPSLLPLEPRLDALAVQKKDDPGAMSLIDMTRREIAVRRAHHDE